MSLTPLTTGCLVNIMADTYEGDEPILQVLGTKKINSGGANDRYRLLLSDGKYLQSFSMLSTQQNELVMNGKLADFTIVRVKQHITSKVNKGGDADEKKVLIIINCEPLHPGSVVGKKIGDPISVADAQKLVPSAKPEPPSTAKTSYRPPPASSDHLNASISEGKATQPISSLSPYQNKWVIKARITAKPPVRTWSNAKGEGKLFSFDMMDESGSIRATVFRDLVDKYYDMIQVDKVFYITKCQVKPANKQFSRLPHDYELTFSNETVVQECTDDDDLPTVKYEFIPISQISSLESNATVDIIGVCRDVGELRTFTAKTTGRELKKRDLTLVDNSNAAVNVTLWGQEADEFNNNDNPVLLVHAGRVNEFNGGKSVSIGSGSVIKVNPDCVEGHRLRGWFDNGGAENIDSSVSARTGGGDFNTEWLTFHEAKQKNLGQGDKPDYFQLKGIVHIVKANNAAYKACPQADCNKKVVDMENGQFRCEKCNTEYPNFKYRLMLNMSLADWTSNRWVTAFADTAEAILGKSSQEIGEALEMNKDEGEAMLTSVQFKPYLFKLRTKVEYFSDSPRNKITVQSVSPLNYKDYNEYLIKNIQRLTGVGKH